MDVRKYEYVMHTIKGRKEHIEWIANSAGSMGRVSWFMVESICLQLRMMIEDIAIACVIANASEMPELAHSLRGEYRPSLILKGLEKINPECYPTPVVKDETEGRDAGLMEIRLRPGCDWLTRHEAVQEYGRLSNVIHRNLKAYDGGPVDYLELYRRCIRVENRISNLLSHHRIVVLEENMMYMVLMSSMGVDDNGVPFEGRIQVAPFMLVPESLRQAAMRREITEDDVLTAYERRLTDTD
jgi:hypothetical protein